MGPPSPLSSSGGICAQIQYTSIKILFCVISFWYSFVRGLWLLSEFHYKHTSETVTVIKGIGRDAVPNNGDHNLKVVWTLKGFMLNYRIEDSDLKVCP